MGANGWLCPSADPRVQIAFFFPFISNSTFGNEGSEGTFDALANWRSEDIVSERV